MAGTNITERTLEQEKQGFVKMCRCFEIGANAIRILMLIFIPALIFVMITSATGLVDAGEQFTSAEGLISMCALCVICVGYFVALNFGVSIFRSLRNGETPFRYDVADKLKGAGVAMIVTGIVGFVLNVMVECFIANGMLHFGEMQYLPDTIPFIFGAFLVALAYVFNYGCKLQQESDETL